MKILVVDDEQIMLDSICLILSKEPDLQVETARTGREAIEKAEVFRPELVMMDIKMPGINGLEALTEIRRLDSQAILIILTAYENFNYAQEAIRLNVYDYLVKPINKTRLLELILKAKEQVNKMRELRLAELALRERYRKLLPFIENEFMYELMNGIDEPSLAEYQELLAVKFSRGFFLAISYHDDSNALVDNPIELSYALRQRMADLAEEIRQYIPCLVGPVKTNPMSVFIPIGRDSESKSNLESVDIARKILNQFQNGKKNTEIEIEIEIHIGIGRTYSASSELKRSYQESLLALSYCGQRPVYHYDDFEEQQDQNWETSLSQETQEILEAIKFGNVAKVEALTSRLFEKYTHLQGENRDRLYFHLLEFLLCAYQFGKDLKDLKNANKFPPSFEQIIAIFKDKTDLMEVFREISQRTITLTLIVKDGRLNQVKAIIRQAKDIIDRQFTQHINLEDISRIVGISPFYFSRLFREEIGISFSEYVTKLRMEKAGALLVQGISVKECCFLVGYNDPNYFSRIFRKYYDKTPSEYRDAQIQLKEEHFKC
jgi:two-component system response regulator YesN